MRTNLLQCVGKNNAQAKKASALYRPRCAARVICYNSALNTNNGSRTILKILAWQNGRIIPLNLVLQVGLCSVATGLLFAIITKQHI